MAKLFGTDGIRGVANVELTCQLALKTGIAVTQVLIQENNKKPTIFVGKDPRISSDMIESAILSGICAAGGTAISLGTVPTPAVAYLTKNHNVDAGIMISASHNSFEFNGIKVFDKNGYKLSDEMEEKVENIIQNEIKNLAVNENIGKIIRDDSYLKEYVEYISKTVKLPENNIKILVDCSNGASSFTAKKLFNSLSLKADFIFNSPDGININEKCGSTNIENMSKQVTEGKYDLGIAFDGDADRCLCIDEIGNIIDGDSIMGVCADYMVSKNELKSNALVGTIMSNMGLKKFCKERNINFYETKVGDRHVLEKMIQDDYILGGEQSGHTIFRNHSTTGDGQLTALKFIEVMLNNNKKASELNGLIKKYPQKLVAINIQSHQKGLLAQNETIKNYVENLELELEENGRIIVRESGTEPKIRIMVECNDNEKIDVLLKDISEFISENI